VIPPSYHPNGSLLHVGVATASIAHTVATVPPLDNAMIQIDNDVEIFGDTGNTENEEVTIADADKAPTYGELVNVSTNLAADIVRRPGLSKLWLSLAINASKIVNETPPHMVKGQMLSMATTINAVMAGVVGGSVEPPTISITDNNSEIEDLTNVPRKRGRNGVIGRPNVKRKKSRHEKTNRNPKTIPNCGFCGLPNHRVDGCGTL